ncbi:MAG: hypothetical protein RL038_1268 [Actinomycetota bacterium]|jgi:hypothetical protein
MTELRIIRGDATEEEVAAILLVLKSASRIQVLAEPAKMSKWASPGSLARTRPGVGASAWRQSGWARH